MRFGFNEVDADMNLWELLGAGLGGVMLIVGPLLLKVILGGIL